MVFDEGVIDGIGYGSCQQCQGSAHACAAPHRLNQNHAYAGGARRAGVDG